MTSGLYRKLAPAMMAVAVALPAHAQQNPVCTRLEAQLAAFDRAAADPARGEQARRYDEALSKAQSDLDRLTAQQRRHNCEGGFFVLFGGQSPQCGTINNQVQQVRANVERIQADLARIKGDAGPEREAQRRAILVALSQNDCGAQYRAAVAATQPRGGFFESLFGGGGNSILPPMPSGVETALAGTYRTICVRTCDGYYYPISYATVPSRFADDARACTRSCPAAEVALYSHKNPGEDVNQAVSFASNAPYTALPNAFKYRQAFDNSCSCRKPGETWAQALKPVEDTTIERGDIVVTDERAKILSQPRTDAQGRPIKLDPVAPAARPAAAGRPDPRNPAAPTPPAAAPEPPVVEGSDKPDPRRTVRSVGPTFIPAR